MGSFIVSDTCWSAFTNIALPDWRYYLVRRAEQGFTHIQINSLPQWDRSRPDLGIYPWQSDDGIHFDWSTPSDAYYEHMEEMLHELNRAGLSPALVLAWANYIPGTWAEKISRELLKTETIPLEALLAHVRRTVEIAKDFDPLWIISGDTDFPSDEATSYYLRVLDTVKEQDTDHMCTTHVNRGNTDIPLELAKRLDFLMFQSGHNYEAQPDSWRLPEALCKKYRMMRFMNSEPCYEQMGASRHVYWRYSAKDVRQALWSSVLAGASVGVSYGAHGIWNWQSQDSKSSALGEGFDAGFRWQEALQFRGARDAVYIKEFFEGLIGREDLYLLHAQEYIQDEREAIRAARFDVITSTYLFIYLPFTTRVRLAPDVTPLEAYALDLESHAKESLQLVQDERGFSVSQHSFESDALLVITL